MQTVTNAECHIQAAYAESSYAEWRYAECRDCQTLSNIRLDCKDLPGTTLQLNRAKPGAAVGYNLGW